VKLSFTRCSHELAISAFDITEFYCTVTIRRPARFDKFISKEIGRDMGWRNNLNLIIIMVTK
jgi:hypothetical protein